MPEFNFVKSSYSSSGGECIEVALTAPAPVAIAVRDSKDPDGRILQLSPTAWAAFITAQALDNRR